MPRHAAVPEKHFTPEAGISLILEVISLTMFISLQQDLSNTIA
jgi:hypothetical protein